MASPVLTQALRQIIVKKMLASFDAELAALKERKYAELEKLYRFFVSEEQEKLLMSPANQPFVWHQQEVEFVGTSSQGKHYIDWECKRSVPTLRYKGFDILSLPEEKQVEANSIIHSLLDEERKITDRRTDAYKQIVPTLAAFKTIKALLEGMPEVADLIPDELAAVRTPSRGLVPVEQIQKTRDMIKSVVSATKSAEGVPA